MLTPLGSELVHERICDWRANAVPRRDRPGRVRTALGIALIATGARLAGSESERTSPVRRLS
jgi:hypothetical protein